MLVLCSFLKWFETKRFTGLLELLQLYKQYPLENFLIFTIYYTLALINQESTVGWEPEGRLRS